MNDVVKLERQEPEEVDRCFLCYADTTMPAEFNEIDGCILYMCGNAWGFLAKQSTKLPCLSE